MPSRVPSDYRTRRRRRSSPVGMSVSPRSYARFGSQRQLTSTMNSSACSSDSAREPELVVDPTVQHADERAITHITSMPYLRTAPARMASVRGSRRCRVPALLTPSYSTAVGRPSWKSLRISTDPELGSKASAWSSTPQALVNARSSTTNLQYHEVTTFRSASGTVKTGFNMQSEK